MKIISDLAIATAAAFAQFQGDDQITVVAIALAESGGDLEAVNDTRGRTDLPPGTVPEWSHGLWQDNVLVWTRHDREMLTTNRFYAASCAAEIRREQSFSAWSTYNDGTYLAFVPRAGLAVAINTLTAESAALRALAEGHAPSRVLVTTADYVDNALYAVQQAIKELG